MKTDYRYATLEVNKKKNTKDNLQYISEARELELLVMIL